MRLREQTRRLRQQLRRYFDLHRGRQSSVDRESGHSPGWNRTIFGRGLRRLTGCQIISSAQGMGLDLGELVAETTAPGSAKLLRRVREGTHGQREYTLARRSTVKVETKTAETESAPAKAEPVVVEAKAETQAEAEVKKVLLKTPPTAILNLESAARQVACRRLEQSELSPPPAPTAEEAFSCLLDAPLNHRRQVLRQEPRWRSLAGVKHAALAIDKLRLCAPKEARALAQILAIEIAAKIKGADCAEAFCRAAGVLGSSHRIGASMEGAAFCLETALVIACWAPPGVRADLLQRASFVLSNHGAIEAALAVSGKAMAIYAEQRDSAGMGKVFVDQATFLAYSGQYEEARGSWLNALALLPDTEKHHRAAVYQGLAHLDEQAGRLDTAIEHLRLAQEFIPQRATYLRGKVSWAAGEIARKQGRFGAAESQLRQAVAELGMINPFDLGLVTLDLAELLLETGQAAEAVELAKDTEALLKLFKSNPSRVKTTE